MRLWLNILLLSTLFITPAHAEVEYQNCKTCGYKENTTIDRYCQECGSPLAKKITCPFCEQKNHDGDEYCMNCLKPLRGKTFLDQVRSVKEKVIQDENDEKMLKVSEESLDERAWSETTADILISLKNSDYKSAVKLGGKALAKAKNTFGTDHPKTAESLSILAYIHLQAENYNHAVDLFKESISLLGIIFGEDSEKLIPEKILLLKSFIGGKNKKSADSLLKEIKSNQKFQAQIENLSKQVASIELPKKPQTKTAD